MKKKQIEAVPYITIPGTVQDENVQYAAVAAWKEIAGEKHLLLEVYRNRETCLQVPAVRYVANGTDWGVFFPESGRWTREKLIKFQVPCWKKEDRTTINEENDVLLTPDVLPEIRDHLKIHGNCNYWRWWRYFDEIETGIRVAKQERKEIRRRESLAERIADTPPLNEQDLLEWAGRLPDMKRHFLYYKKKGSHAFICCSKCGKLSYSRWRASEAYPQPEEIIAEPVNGCVGHCPSCREAGIYKPQGRVKSRYEIKTNVYTADRYHGNGVVLRYVYICKAYTFECLNLYSGGIYDASEHMEITELARTYFEPGKKVKTDCSRHNSYIGDNYWDDQNILMSDAYTNIGKAPIYPGIWETLKGTCLQYSALREYAGVKGEVDARRYMTRYMEFPPIEMFVKAGLTGIVDYLMDRVLSNTVIADRSAQQPEEILGIRKEHMKLLIRKNGNVDILRILQEEKKTGQVWTDGQVMALAEAGVNMEQIRTALGILTIQKLLNYIAGYAGCEYGTGCRGAEIQLGITATTYLDYLGMRLQLGYDMTNTVYQHPRDLHAAHDRMVMESNREKMDERIRYVTKKYPDIRARYRKLRKQYFYRDDTYVIRPARSAEEIVHEGRLLHHCVGGDTYLSRHNSGRSTILLLRFRNKPDTPYITVEMDGIKIQQWYGAHDEKPDKKNMEKWLDRYTGVLECRKKGVLQETAVPLLAQA